MSSPPSDPSSDLISEEEAQEIHQERQAADPKHDTISCVCCCLTCDEEGLEFACVGDRVSYYRKLLED